MDHLWWTSRQHCWEQVDNMLVDLSDVNTSSRARTWTARLKMYVQKAGGDSSKYPAKDSSNINVDSTDWKPYTCIVFKVDF